MKSATSIEFDHSDNFVQAIYVAAIGKLLPTFPKRGQNS